MADFPAGTIVEDRGPSGRRWGMERSKSMEARVVLVAACRVSLRVDRDRGGGCWYTLRPYAAGMGGDCDQVL